MLLASTPGFLLNLINAVISCVKRSTWSFMIAVMTKKRRRDFIGGLKKQVQRFVELVWNSERSAKSRRHAQYRRAADPSGTASYMDDELITTKGSR